MVGGETDREGKDRQRSEISAERWELLSDEDRRIRQIGERDETRGGKKERVYAGYEDSSREEETADTECLVHMPAP